MIEPNANESALGQPNQTNTNLAANPAAPPASLSTATPIGPKAERTVHNVDQPSPSETARTPESEATGSIPNAELHLVSGPRRTLYFILGWIFLILGIAGHLLPVLPGTVFTIQAAIFFFHSSPRFHRWMLNHRYLGPMVRDWYERGGVRPLVKYGTLGVTVFFLVVYFSYVIWFWGTRWTLLLTPIWLLMMGVAWWVSRLPVVRQEAKNPDHHS